MAKIQVRNFPDDVYLRVQAAAAVAERSIESECRLALIEKFAATLDSGLTSRQRWRKDVGSRLALIFEKLRSDGFFSWDQPSDLPHIALQVGESSPALLFDCFDGIDDLPFDLASRLSNSFGFSLKWLLSGERSPFPVLNIGSSYADFFKQTEDGRFSWELYRVEGGRSEGELICLKTDNENGKILLGYINEHFVLTDGMGGGGRGNLEDFIKFLKTSWPTLNITTWVYEAGESGPELGQHHPVYYQRLMKRSSSKWLMNIFEGKRPGPWLTEFDSELNSIKAVSYGLK